MAAGARLLRALALCALAMSSTPAHPPAQAQQGFQFPPRLPSFPCGWVPRHAKTSAEAAPAPWIAPRGRPGLVSIYGRQGMDEGKAFCLSVCAGLTTSVLIATGLGLPLEVPSVAAQTQGGLQQQAAAQGGKGEDRKSDVRKSNIKLASPLVPAADGSCSNGFRKAVESAGSSTVVCRPSSVETAAAAYKKVLQQAQREAKKSVGDKMGKMRAAQSKEEAALQKLAEQDAKKKFLEEGGGGAKKGVGDVAKQGEEEKAKDGVLPAEVQREIVRKTKARAYASSEAAVAEAKAKYAEAEERADQKIAEIRRLDLQRATQQKGMDAQYELKKVEKRLERLTNKRIQEESAAKMLKAQEDEMIKQMEFGLDAPVTPIVPSVPNTRK